MKRSSMINASWLLLAASACTGGTPGAVGSLADAVVDGAGPAETSDADAELATPALDFEGFFTGTVTLEAESDSPMPVSLSVTRDAAGEHLAELDKFGPCATCTYTVEPGQASPAHVEGDQLVVAASIRYKPAELVYAVSMRLTLADDGLTGVVETSEADPASGGTADLTRLIADPRAR